ncbi:hypothetical protein [Devosia sp. CAU 1758]
MPRAAHPNTPQDELAALNTSAASRASTDILTDDIAAFCQSGVSVIVALGGAGAVPQVGNACGCRLFEDGLMRVLLHRSGNQALLDAAIEGAPLAVTFSRPITHRSIQVKGPVAAVATLSETDRQAGIDQAAGLDRELRDTDYPARFTTAFCHVDAADLAGIDFRPQSVFVQTPGPGAGAELKT